MSACRRVGLNPAEADDIARDGLVRAARNDFAALRNTGPQVLLSLWARGVARNLAHERLRNRRVARLVDEPAARFEFPADAPISGWEAVDFSSLTAKEEAAIRERIGGRSEREAANRLRISRATLRDRVARAVRRLRRAHGTMPPLPDMSRRWAEELIEGRQSPLAPRERKALLLYARGATRASIADELGMTANAVKCLLGRLKRDAGG